MDCHILRELSYSLIQIRTKKKDSNVFLRLAILHDVDIDVLRIW